ncbi:MAG TPA: hypothetical protein VIV65_08780 [Gemmatimonadaceae bacterium]
MSLLDREGIAQRIRSLIAHETHPASAAELLRVPKSELKAAVDPVAPFQSMNVLEAIVREYGVDPSWLVTGDYDIRTHVLSVDEGPHIVRGLVNAQLLARTERDVSDGPSD